MNANDNGGVIRSGLTRGRPFRSARPGSAQSAAKARASRTLHSLLLTAAMGLLALL